MRTRNSSRAPNPEKVRNKALQQAVLKQMRKADPQHTCPACGGQMKSDIGLNGPFRACVRCGYGLAD